LPPSIITAKVADLENTISTREETIHHLNEAVHDLQEQLTKKNDKIKNLIGLKTIQADDLPKIEERKDKPTLSTHHLKKISLGIQTTPWDDQLWALLDEMKDLSADVIGEVQTLKHSSSKSKNDYIARLMYMAISITLDNTTGRKLYRDCCPLNISTKADRNFDHCYQRRISRLRFLVNH
jgi:uncharacterized coiled-coil protein SlyX